jgi:hypothetical protein
MKEIYGKGKNYVLCIVQATHLISLSIILKLDAEVSGVGHHYQLVINKLLRAEVSE